MKRMRFAGHNLASIVAMGMLGASSAVAQYAPYPQAYPTASSGYGQPYQAHQTTVPPVYSQQQPAPGNYSTPQQQQQQPQQQQQSYPGTYQPPVTHAPQQQYGRYPTTQQQPYAQEPYVQQPAGGYPTTSLPPVDQRRYAMADQAETLPPQPPQPAEVVPAPANHNGYAPQWGGHVPPQAGYAPHQNDYAPEGGYYHGGVPSSYVGAADCNCNDMGSWNAYMHGPQYGPTGQYGGACGPEGCPPVVASGRQWFFGAYALGMSRDRPGYERFAVYGDAPGPGADPMDYPYYPMPGHNALCTGDIDPDFQWGAEIRFGSTFGKICGPSGVNYGCEPCAPCAAQRPYAWEVVYWGLSEDDQMASVMPTGMYRLYNTVNFGGIEYGGMPLNPYSDYGMPVPAEYEYRLTAVRVRNQFKAQNLELNFIRFPVAGCSPCDPCAAPNRFTVSGVCGVRYLRLDEDFQLGYMYEDAGMVAGDFYYDIETDNQLVGFQLGGNMNWAVGCKWDLFCDTTLGIYNNRIDVYQRIYDTNGGMYDFANGGQAAMVRSRKDDVAFMGEARLGVGYQILCNCRLTAAYRVMAISGVALATEQIPSDFSTYEHVAWIDSNDSLVLHGVQLGAEFKY